MRLLVELLPALVLLGQSSAIEDYVVRACSVYCTGPILNNVQLAGIFEDSKTFVDMPLKVDPEEALSAFAALDDPTDKDTLTSFLNEYFLEAGSDVVSSNPVDYNPYPPFLQRMPEDYIYKDWAKSLNDLWNVLGRNVSSQVKSEPQRHSFVPRRYPMIVPGGRFRESYYWDSFWIVRGLLVCDMYISARNVIDNLLDDVRNFGFVPNGGRIYYLDRSQPPLLSDMVTVYYDYYVRRFGWTSELDIFLQDALSLLLVEHDWWMSINNQHAVSINWVDANGEHQTGTLNRYHSNFTTPRPESYAEDYSNSLQAQRSQAAVDSFYQAVRSGAETGWDFSSRWISGGGSNISFIDTPNVLPVELNAIMYRMERNIANLALTLGDVSSARRLSTAAADRLNAFQAIFWDGEAYMWRDFNITTGAWVGRGTAATIASYLPLWAGIMPPTSGSLSSTSADRMVESLQASGLLQIAGVLTTTQNTGQQWDAPNAWPPLVLMTIEGLRNLNSESSISLAANLTQHWLNTCYRAFNSSGFMYEKYDAFVVGKGGGGGEYVPQIGFGWSNAVALLLIDSTLPDDPSDSNGTPMAALIIGLGVAGAVIAAAGALLCVWRQRQRSWKSQQHAEEEEAVVLDMEEAFKSSTPL